MSTITDYDVVSDYGDVSLLPVSEHTDAYAGNHKSAYLALTLAGTAVLLIIYMLSKTMSWENATAAGVIFGLTVIAIHIAWRLRTRPRNYLSPDIFYLIFYAAFHFSYLVLWLMGIVDAAGRAGERVFPAPRQYPLVMLIVNLGLLGFLFGYELAAPRRKFDTLTQSRKTPTALWTIVGIVFMLAALITHLAFIFHVGITTWFLQGYTVYAHMEEFSQYDRLWRFQFQFFALGFGIYITSVALRYRRLFKGKLGIILFSIYLFLLVMEGGRTQLVTHGMIILLVRHFVIKPIKLRWLLVITICALTAFTLIKLVRQTAAFNIPKMVEMVGEARRAEEIHWYDSFVEMGSSIGTVNLTTAVVPSTHPYWHGRSYIQAVTHIIPYMSTVLMPYLGASPSVWLTDVFYGAGAAGTGFSIAAEGYLNFGLVGAFMHMAVLGIILRWIYARFATTMSPVSTLVFIVAYGLFMITVRNHVNLLISPLVKVIVVAWLLKSFCGEEEVAAVGYEEAELAEWEGEDYERVYV